MKKPVLIQLDDQLCKRFKEAAARQEILLARAVTTAIAKELKVMEK